MPLESRLPLLPPGAQIVSPELALANEGGRVIFFNAGGPILSFEEEDAEARRLAVAMLAQLKLATPKALAESLGIHRNMVFAYRKQFAERGASALRTRKSGPKAAHKLRGPVLRRALTSPNSSASCAHSIASTRWPSRSSTTWPNAPGATPGQALRGSSDLHAWTDSTCYLLRRADALRLVVEHRAAAAPEPLEIHVVQEPCRLEVRRAETAPLPLAEAVCTELRRAEAPLSRAALRRTLKVNNARLGKTLEALEARGLLKRCPGGWALAVGAPEQMQLAS